MLHNVRPVKTQVLATTSSHPVLWHLLFVQKEILASIHTVLLHARRMRNVLMIGRCVAREVVRINVLL